MMISKYSPLKVADTVSSVIGFDCEPLTKNFSSRKKYKYPNVQLFYWFNGLIVQKYMVT